MHMDTEYSAWIGLVGREDTVPRPDWLIGGGEDTMPRLDWLIGGGGVDAMPRLDWLL